MNSDGGGDNSSSGEMLSSSSILLQRRFLLQQDYESGYTPFHKAIVDGNLPAILLFLRHVMDINSTERLIQRPMTALHSAEATFAASASNNNSGNHQHQHRLYNNNQTTSTATIIVYYI